MRVWRRSGPRLPARTRYPTHATGQEGHGRWQRGMYGRRHAGEKQRGALTVSQASRHAGRGECVTLLGVDELAHGGQLVDFAVSWGAGTEGRLRRHRGPGAGETRLEATEETTTLMFHTESGSRGVQAQEAIYYALTNKSAAAAKITKSSVSNRRDTQTSGFALFVANICLLSRKVKNKLSCSIFIKHAQHLNVPTPKNKIKATSPAPSTE